MSTLSYPFYAPFDLVLNIDGSEVSFPSNQTVFYSLTDFLENLTARANSSYPSVKLTFSYVETSSESRFYVSTLVDEAASSVTILPNELTALMGLNSSLSVDQNGASWSASEAPLLDSTVKDGAYPNSSITGPAALPGPTGSQGPRGDGITVTGTKGPIGPAARVKLWTGSL